MGLLDDAIREHLELKLRNGADPQQIELQEREALEPVTVDPALEPHYDEEPEYSQVPPDPAAVGYEEPASDVAPQETVEFDMRTVMDAPAEHGGPVEDEAHPGQGQLGLE